MEKSESNGIKSGAALMAMMENKRMKEFAEKYEDYFLAAADEINKLYQQIIENQTIFGTATVMIPKDAWNGNDLPPARLITYNPTTCYTQIPDETMEKLTSSVRDLEEFANFRDGDPFSWEQMKKAQTAVRELRDNWPQSLVGFIKPPYDQDPDDELTVPIQINGQTKMAGWDDVMRAARPGLVDSYEKTRVACNHNFVSYTGLNETFEYCKNCNKKKGEL